MVVQSTNTGGDLGENHFDIQMPGGGVGIFDGCTPQWGALAGAQYGGISSQSECNSYPELLKDGCNWRFDWFQNADNPDFTFEQVQCPKALTDITGCKRTDDSSFPAFEGDSSSGSSKPAATSKASAAVTSKATAAVTSKSAAAVTSEAAAVVTSEAAAVVPAKSSTSSKAPVAEQSSTAKETVSSKTKSACSAPKSSTTKAAATDAPTSAEAVAAYQQCGGSKEAFPNGSLPCVSGSKCVFSNDWYSQCVPN